VTTRLLAPMSLRMRVALMVMLAMAVFAWLVIWYSQSQLESASRESARAEVVAIASAVDSSFEEEGLDTPSVLLREIEALTEERPAIREAVIYAPFGGAPIRLVTTDRAQIGRPVPPEHLTPFATGEPAYRTTGEGEDGTAELMTPLRDDDGRVAAVLGLRLDLAPGKEVLARRTRDLRIAGIATALLMAGVVLVLLARTVERPLRRISAATRRIAAGELATRLRWRQADEIGQLARAFDAMAEALEGTHRRMEQGTAELRRAQNEQERLRRVAESVAAEDDSSVVLARAAEEVAGLLGADAAAVTRFDGPRLSVVGRWTSSGSSGLWLDRRGATARVRETGAVATVVRPVEIDGEARRRASVAAPVRVAGVLWGAVGAVALSPRELPADAAPRLERFAWLVGLAIANASARERLREQAATDALTGLANHRAFQEALAGEVARARRHERPLSLVVLDLDHFKRVNDRHGHQVGDGVLREAARRLGEAVRDGDTLARVGGEEFAWLMPETSGMEAWRAAERARAAIAAEPFADVGRITISAGVCDLDHAGDAGELYRLADGALYWSKHHGRDVVCRYSPDVVEVLSDAEQAARLGRQQALQSIRVLARAVDAKDPSTREHSERVGDLAVALATAMGWPVERAAQLREAGLVHDVGKIAIPDTILSKRGRLDEAEFAVVRTHAAIGAEMLTDVLSPEQVSWVRGHHERWDGRGYPDALRGEEIPEGARILALADAWDVMTSDRLYSSALGIEEAAAEVRECSGGQFWPEAAEALGLLVAARALPGRPAGRAASPGGRPA
jgi:diguanylate cyclase (GGDEF)-like protein